MAPPRLDELRAERDRLDDRLAERVAEFNAIEEQIARKRDAREDHVPDSRRWAELQADLDKLMRERRALKARIAELEPKLERATRRARRLARRLRNRVKPEVVDLGFDRTAVRPLTPAPAAGTVVGHYTAGPVDDDGDDEAFALWRAYDRAHKAQNWACLGYNVGVTRDGTIVRLRGLEWVGAHTLNFNTGHPGISVHGTTGDTWTKPQRRALRHLLRKFDLDDNLVIGHREAPGQATACPGSFLAGYKSKGRAQ